MLRNINSQVFKPPTLLGAGGVKTLQDADILSMFGGGQLNNKHGQSIVLTSSVTAGVMLKNCDCGCGLSFITTLPNQKYIDNSHRQRAYRHRQNETTSTTKSCLWCGSSSNMPKAKQAKFCCASHRTMSYRKQRKMMLKAFAQFSRVDMDTAHDIADRVGSKKMRLVLEDAGYQYDYQNRVWING